MREFKTFIVDDFEGFRRFLSSKLQQNGWQHIHQASDGVEAVQKAKELQPDLILLDIGLPKLCGIEAGKLIRLFCPRTKILFVSQESSPDIVEEALRLGAMGYVHKACAQRDLLPAIEAVLSGETFLSSGLDLKKSVEVDPTSRYETLFFSDEAALLDDFARAIATALNTGNSAIAVVSASHQRALLRNLEKHVLDVGQAMQRGNYRALDVAEVLRAIMVDGLPDPARFFGATRGLIDTASKAATAEPPRVLMCGDGVAVLLAEGKEDAARMLDQLCSDLAKTGVDVMCAHPVKSPRPVER